MLESIPCVESEVGFTTLSSSLSCENEKKSQCSNISISIYSSLCLYDLLVYSSFMFIVVSFYSYIAKSIQ